MCTTTRASLSISKKNCERFFVCVLFSSPTRYFFLSKNRVLSLVSPFLLDDVQKKRPKKKMKTLNPNKKKGRAHNARE